MISIYIYIGCLVWGYITHRFICHILTFCPDFIDRQGVKPHHDRATICLDKKLADESIRYHATTFVSRVGSEKKVTLFPPRNFFFSPPYFLPYLKDSIKTRRSGRGRERWEDYNITFRIGSRVALCWSGPCGKMFHWASSTNIPAISSII